jgi:hypothetical protein
VAMRSIYRKKNKKKKDEKTKLPSLGPVVQIALLYRAFSPPCEAVPLIDISINARPPKATQPLSTLHASTPCSLKQGAALHLLTLHKARHKKMNSSASRPDGGQLFRSSKLPK